MNPWLNWPYFFRLHCGVCEGETMCMQPEETRQRTASRQHLLPFPRPNRSLNVGNNVCWQFPWWLLGGLCVCLCFCNCGYLCVYIYVCLSVCVCMCVSIYVCVCVCAFMCQCVCMHACVCVRSCLCACLYVRVCVLVASVERSRQDQVGSCWQASLRTRSCEGVILPYSQQERQEGRCMILTSRWQV